MREDDGVLDGREWARRFAEDVARGKAIEAAMPTFDGDGIRLASPPSPATAPEISPAVSPYAPLSETERQELARMFPHLDWLRRYEATVRTLQGELEEMRELAEKLKAQLAPCGECHLRPGERCDICGKVRDA